MRFIAPLALLASLFFSTAALAEVSITIPYAAELGEKVMHWGGFPTPVGPVAEKITWLYNLIFIIIAVIFIVVAVPMGYIMWRYRSENVAKPATFSHSLRLELLWTIIPALICVFIAYESARAMFKIRTMPENAVNVEVVAYQFGWNFYYPDYSEAGKHVAAPEPTADDPEVSLPGAPRLAKTMVVPVGKPVVLHITAQDVIHAYYVPKLGIKMDAIPGRINYAWFKADKPGNFLGQCTELCGSAHGEMFFRVEAVEPEAFKAFIAAQQLEAGITPAAVSGTTAVTPSAPAAAVVSAAI
jgi:cytochrome c oxidase subunit 2